MAWIRIDDSFADHPKILAAGPLAAILQIRALCWSSRHLTDGFLPMEVIPTLLSGFDRIGVDEWTVGHPPIAAGGSQANEINWSEIMVNAGLWDHKTKQNGFLIHDYLEYNRSKTEIMVIREQKASAGKIGGIRSGQSRLEARCLPPATPSGSEVLNSQSPSPTQTQKDKEQKKEPQSGPKNSAPHFPKQPFGEFQRVTLTVHEHGKLLERLGHHLTETLITELDREMEAGGGKLTNGRKVASAYATILKWAAGRAKRDVPGKSLQDHNAEVTKRFLEKGESRGTT